MKRLVSLTLALAMALTLAITAFAIEPEAAAKDLGKYGIMGGFPDGTLRLEQTVTRAQITKMITTALKFDNSNIGFSRFTDVPATHWAKNHIFFANMEGIIGGFPDGTFKPEANVTACQAIKMVVCLLGYDKYDADDKPGYKTLTYPRDYLNAACNRGLINSPFVEDVPATRGFVASLIATALDLPIAKQVGISMDGDIYRLLDGTNGKELVTLRTQLEG